MPQSHGDLNATLSQFWALAIRRRWWILLATCAVSLASVRVSYMIPDRYRSEAMIFITRPNVPQQYIVLNNTANAMDAVEAIKRQVLSRARLQKIIDDFGLYPSRRELGSAALTDLMRTDIEVQSVSKDPERRPMNAFVIAFTGADPHVAQQVANEVASLFIKANEQKQNQANSATTRFLQTQLANAKQDLDRQAALVRDYKAQNLGELPEQSAGNVDILNGLQIQFQSTQAGLARARQERTYLQSMLSHYSFVNGSKGGQEVTGTHEVATLQAELSKLKSQRDEILSRYSPLYPDVVALNDQIAEGEAQLNRITSSTKKKQATGSDSSSRAELVLPTDPAALQLKSQLDANAVEIEESQRQAKDLAAQIADYQRRLTVAPLRQQQYDEVERNYDLAKENYANLVNKEAQSGLATKLEMEQGDEQFQIIDQASLPLKPTSPNRQKLALAGLGAGLCFGYVLAFLADARDRSFHSEDEVRAFLPVPLLVGIPALLLPQESRKLTRRTRFEWAMGCLILVTVLAAQMYVHYRG